MKKHYTLFLTSIKVVVLLSFFTMCSDKKNNKDIDNAYTNLKYGNSPSQVLDLQFPDNPNKITKPLNAILFIHGGGWQEGDKNVYSDAIIDLSKKFNFLAASMNYRMIGDGAKCDDMLEDIKHALVCIKNKANEYGVSINKVILMGASAGAHLSLLYTYKNHGNSPIPIAFCVSQSAPTDFTDSNLYTNNNFSANYMLNCVSHLTGHEITHENYLEKENILLSISPINYITPNIPPTLYSHGIMDDLVPISNAYRLQEYLISKDVEFNFFVYPNSGHELDNDPSINEDFFNKMFDYIYNYTN